MNAKLMVGASLAAVAIFGLAGPATAADGPYFSWAGLPTPVFLSDRGCVSDNVPYFAAHPPVYYSYPESRPYGLLPCPYAPASADREPCPMVVENPYVQRPEGITTAAVSATGPETVLNPYVVQGDDPTAKPESGLPSRVDVVYPAQMFAGPR